MIGRQRRAPAAPNAKHLLRRGAAKLRRLGRDNGGSVVILAGFLFPVVIGGMGLGAETGYWYWTQRKLQHSADVSAYAAAVRASQKDSQTEYKRAALHVAEEAGYLGGEPGIQVNSPPQAPSEFEGEPDHIQVILTESLPRLFTSVFTSQPMALSGRAVASIKYGTTGCVLALSATAPSAMKLSGNANIELRDCDVAANSVAKNSFDMQGGAKLSTGCVHTAGGASPTTGLRMSECEEVDEYAPKALDPYADVIEPEEQGACEDRTFTPSGARDLEPRPQNHPSGLPVYRFCGNVTFKGTVNFKPGLYIFSCPQSGSCSNISVSATGSATAGENTTLTGEDVTFYLAPGIKLNFNGQAEIRLKARTDDPYAGILFFSSRDTSVSHVVNGGASGDFQGAVYFPTGNIQYAGGASTGGKCIQIIGATVEFTGASKISSDCTGKGTREMTFGQQIAIVE